MKKPLLKYSTPTARALVWLLLQAELPVSLLPRLQCIATRDHRLCLQPHIFHKTLSLRVLSNREQANTTTQDTTNTFSTKVIPHTDTIRLLFIRQPWHRLRIFTMALLTIQTIRIINSNNSHLALGPSKTIITTMSHTRLRYRISSNTVQTIISSPTRTHHSYMTAVIPAI